MVRNKRFREKILKALSPDHQYLQETQYSMEAAQGYTYFYIPFAIMDYSHFSNITLAQGKASRLLGATANEVNQSSYKLGGSCTMEIRNTNPHPMYMTVYWLYPRFDMWVSDDSGFNTVGATYIPNETSASGYAINLLWQGLVDRELLADAVTVPVIQQVPGASAVALKCNVNSLTPYMSTFLTHNFKIVRGESGFLAARKTHVISKRNNFDRKYDQLYQGLNITGQPALGATQVTLYKHSWKGMTCIPMIKWHMATGHDSGNALTTGFMAGHLNMLVTERYHVYFYGTEYDLIGYGSKRNKTFDNANMVGPSADPEIKEE